MWSVYVRCHFDDPMSFEFYLECILLGPDGMQPGYYEALYLDRSTLRALGAVRVDMKGECEVVWNEVDGWVDDELGLLLLRATRR